MLAAIEKMNGQNLSRSRCLLTVAIVLATMLSGCAKFDMKRRIPWGDGKDGEPETPMKVVACWTDTVMQTEGKPAMRGFGGRLTFYGQTETEPVKVDGTLVIYAFDETGGQTEKVTPDRKFVFQPDQFEQHCTDGKRGCSYSFWIPWDVAGGEQREISLIARFTPKKGGVVVSEQTRHLLPGTVPQFTNTTVKQTVSGPPKFNSAVQQAGFSEPAQGGPAQAEKKMETTTIHLPRRPTTPRAGQEAASMQMPATAMQQQSTGAYPPPQSQAAFNDAAMMGQSTGPQYYPPVNPAPQYGAQGIPAQGAGAAAGWNNQPQQQAGSFNVSVSKTPPADSSLAAKYAERQAATQQQTRGIQNPRPLATQPPGGPAARFGPQRLRPLGEPIARLNSDHARWQPRQLESQSDPTSSPAPGSQTAAAGTFGGAR
jgi:hypothetical protein